MKSNPWGASFLTLSGTVLFIGIILVLANAVRERPVYADDPVKVQAAVVPVVEPPQVPAALPVQVTVALAPSEQTLGEWWASLKSEGLSDKEIARVFVRQGFDVADWDSPLSVAKINAKSRRDVKSSMSTRNVPRTPTPETPKLPVSEPVVSAEGHPDIDLVHKRVEDLLRHEQAVNVAVERLEPPIPVAVPTIAEGVDHNKVPEVKMPDVKDVPKGSWCFTLWHWTGGYCFHSKVSCGQAAKQHGADCSYTTKRNSVEAEFEY